MIGSLYLVELTVSDFRASVAWYRDVLELPLLVHNEAEQFALFQAGSARLALKAGTPLPGSVLLTFEVKDLAGEAGRLAAQDVRFEGTMKVSPEGYRRVRLRDPDGYALSLFEWLQPAGGPAAHPASR